MKVNGFGCTRFGVPREIVMVDFQGGSRLGWKELRGLKLNVDSPSRAETYPPPLTLIKTNKSAVKPLFDLIETYYQQTHQRSDSTLILRWKMNVLS